MSASHTVELMGLLQSAWPPYALPPLELDRQLRRYCNGNRMLLGTSGLSLEAKQLEKLMAMHALFLQQNSCSLMFKQCF